MGTFAPRTTPAGLTGRLPPRPRRGRMASSAGAPVVTPAGGTTGFGSVPGPSVRPLSIGPHIPTPVPGPGPSPAVQVVNAWSAFRVITAGTGVPAPQAMSLACRVAPTAGNWLIALCSWTLPGAAYLGATVAVADDAGTGGARNFWQPLGAPAGTSSADGLTRCSIWAAPNVAVPPSGAFSVYVAPCAPGGPVYPAVLIVTVAEVTGMSDYLGTPSVVTGSGNAASMVTANAGAPLGQALMITVGASDGAAPAGPGAGWTGLPSVGIDNGAPAILRTAPAYAVTSAGLSASWSVPTPADLSAATAVILVANPAPVQPDWTWPFTQLQGGFGSGALTPPDVIGWTDLSDRYLAGKTQSASRGKSYELGDTQAGSIAATVANNDSALTPGNTASPFYPGVQSDTPLRLLMTWRGRTYPVWSGTIEALPQEWSPATRYGLAALKVTDAWSLLGDSLRALLQEEILADSPTHYWACGDAQAATVSASGVAQNTVQAANSAPGSTTPLQVVESKSGALGATFAFGADSGVLPGDPDATVYSQADLPTGGQGYGYCLMAADGNYPPLTGAVTLAGWFNPSGGMTQVNANLILLRGTSAAVGPAFQVHLGNPSNPSPGSIGVVMWDRVTRTGTITTVDARNWLTAGWFHIALIVSTSTWQLFINGAAAGSGAADLPTTIEWLTYLGVADRYHTGGMLNGECAQLAVFGQALTPDRVQSIFLAGAPTPLVLPGPANSTVTGAQFTGEFPASRIERLAAYGGWWGARAISQSSGLALAPVSDIQGNATTTPAGNTKPATDGQKAGQAVANIVTTDSGWCYADGGGVLRYISRTDLYPQPTTWELGENAAQALNAAPTFPAGVGPWAGQNGATVAWAPTPPYGPRGALLFSGDGTTANPQAASEATIPVTAEQVYQVTPCCLYSPQGWSTATVGVTWYTPGGVFLSASSRAIALPAASPKWPAPTFTAAAGAGRAQITIQLTGTPAASVQCYVSSARLIAANPEIPYQAGVTFSQDKAQFYDSVELTQSYGPGVTLSAQSPGAVAQHGQSQFSATVYQRDVGDIGDQVNWVLNTRSTLGNRAGTVVVDAGKNEDLWEFVLSVEPATPVQVTRRPWTAPQPTVAQAVVAQVTKSIDFAGRTATAELTTDLFPEGTVLIAGDPVRGQLSGSNVLSY